jgi:predicted Ser/Thr protein kinase
MDNDKTEARGLDLSDKSALSQSLAAAVPGVSLGRQLGKGGMAVVYEGMDEGFNPPRRVAVKLMSAALSADPEFRSRFEREASLVADFRHDNIVRVYSSGEATGAKFIVMEYLGGGTLAEKIEGEPMPPLKAVQIGARLADALAYSHSLGIVHRDFKPGNVMFTADEKPILSDFGIAKATSLTGTGPMKGSTVIGAPRYMAPEQARGDPVTDRADVYSFGLTLFEMLMGRLPDNPERVLRKPEDGKGIHAAIDRISPAIAKLICRCLLFEPAARPSAAECESQLSAEMTTSALSSSARRSTRTAIGLIAAFAAVVGATIGVMKLRQPDAQVPAKSAALVTLPLQRLPLTARVFVDGKPVDAAAADLAPGKHEIVAVSPGFYGAIRQVTLAAGSQPDPVNFTLEATTLPKLDEEQNFLKLADAPKLSAADLSDIQERTLAIALQAKLLRQEGKTAAAESLEHDVQTLRWFGDTRAAVAALLIESVRTGNLSRSQVTKPLIAASETGDAMASLFLAVAYRNSIKASDASELMSDPQFQNYCKFLGMARAQGWTEVASEHIRRDRCTS